MRERSQTSWRVSECSMSALKERAGSLSESLQVDINQHPRQNRSQDVCVVGTITNIHLEDCGGTN